MDGMPCGERARPGAVAVVVNMVRNSGRGEERIPPSLAGFSPFHSFSIFIFFFLACFEYMCFGFLGFIRHRIPTLRGNDGILK
jgi:hypothetical protein